MTGPMVCGHGLFQNAVTDEPAATVAESCGSVVVPGLLHARSGSVVVVIGL